MTHGKNPWKMCRHCNAKKVNRPRGLCWGCYYRTGVRDLYPSTSKYARRGVSNITGNRPKPAFSTQAEPGTDAKISILQLRAALGEELFHPDDLRNEFVPSAESDLS